MPDRARHDGKGLTAMLAAENVDLYYGAAQALRRVSISAEVGKVTALMGRNGVGKTSFLRAVVGEPEWTYPISVACQ